MPLSTLAKAITIILFGMVAFDLMSVVIRMLSSSYPILQISVLRNIIGIIPALALLIMGPGLNAVKKLNKAQHWKIIFIRSAAVLMAQLSFYTALTKIEFATASTLVFTSPFFITLLSIPLLGHRIGLIRFVAVIGGFLGVVVIFKPYNDAFTAWMLLPVLAGFGYGLSSVLVKLIPDEIPSTVIQITQQIITFTLGFFFLLGVEDFIPLASMSDLLLFILMGICGGIGVLCLVIAYRSVDPSSISVFEYFGIPVSFTLGWVFFNETPFTTLFPGVLLIILGGILIILRERRLSRQNFQPRGR